MTTQFKPLPYTFLPHNTRLRSSGQRQAGKMTLGDPAIRVMTDLAYTATFTISKLQNIGDANEKMKHCGVRMLLVTNGDGTLAGLITTSDIFGERPINYIHEHGGNHDSIDVKDIMTPMHQLDALRMSDVMRASVGDIVKTLEHHGRQHLIVYEDTAGHDNYGLRGIFSSTQVARELGQEIHITPKAHSFAEVEQALNA